MIEASMVKQLREKTSAGIMDCKKALIETKGDYEKAVDWLRKKGLSTALKKSDRVTAEGLTAISIGDRVGAVIEVNSETDFVARNQKFKTLIQDIAKLALEYTDLESLKSVRLPNGKLVSEEIIDAIAVVGENLNIRRVDRLKVSEGVIISYVHNKVSDNLGNISVIVGLESTSPNKVRLEEVGKQIAMHIAANSPYSIDIDSLDPTIVQREKEIFIVQSKESGKDSNIIDKMIVGRVNKFYSEVVLLEQKFLFDDKLKVSDVIIALSKELGTDVKITKFIMYKLGENIEKEEFC